MNYFKTITNGLIKENPTFVLMLGMCPTLGTTTSALNGMSMGLATTFVLICSNVVISLLKNLIPDKIRIPAFIVVIATFVTIIQMAMEAYLPALYDSLGLFIPLIVVNCIVLGRAEAFAAKNNPFASLCDGLGIGLCRILSDHPGDFLVGFCVHYVEACVEGRKRCKVLMSVDECRSKNFLSKVDDFQVCKRLG